MVSEFILDIVFNIVEWILSPMPEVSLSVDWTSGSSNFLSIVRCVLYMLPVGTITTIIGIIVAISLFRIFISLIKTIWEILPIV